MADRVSPRLTLYVLPPVVVFGPVVFFAGFLTVVFFVAGVTAAGFVVPELVAPPGVEVCPVCAPLPPVVVGRGFATLPFVAVPPTAELVLPAVGSVEEGVDRPPRTVVRPVMA